MVHSCAPTSVSFTGCCSGIGGISIVVSEGSFMLDNAEVVVSLLTEDDDLLLFPGIHGISSLGSSRLSLWTQVVKTIRIGFRWLVQSKQIDFVTRLKRLISNNISKKRLSWYFSRKFSLKKSPYTHVRAYTYKASSLYAILWIFNIYRGTTFVYNLCTINMFLILFDETL